MRDHPVAAQPLPGAPPVRSPAAHIDSCGPLKELLDRHHAAPAYSTARLAGAPASDPMQFTCSLTVPELRKPGSDEVLLPEATYTASGRGAKDAEQAAARQAVAAAEKAGLAM
ncbi:hypothetical protein COHA_008809 [Chlorella ohadii]|uniref:DRBM domain-containing protein n=1 Tax=Chlorella ohadii TaxID=2649997 RepID=A0AAD5DG30_9CHLO|nr:hypothetical protein COHA_008809 [Chlorella ohadii]